MIKTVDLSILVSQVVLVRQRCTELGVRDVTSRLRKVLVHHLEQVIRDALLDLLILLTTLLDTFVLPFSKFLKRTGRYD